MNRKKTVATFVTFLCLCVEAFGGTLSKVRCGGDGPRPLIDISDQVETNTRWLGTTDSIAEFVALEKSGRWVYRTQSGSVQLLDPVNRTTTSLGLSKLPLSRVIDFGESWLTVTLGSWIRPILGGKSWEKFGTRPLHPIFWQGNRLTAIEEVQDSLYGRRFDVYRYVVGGTLRRSCSVHGYQIEEGKLAFGHSAPHLFFFSSVPTLTGYRVSLWKLETESCRLTQLKFPGRFHAPAKQLARFERLQSTAVVLDSQTENLFWQKGNSCKTYSVNDGELFFLRAELPVFAHWSKSKELSLLFANEERSVRILRSLPIEGVRQEDLWIDAGGTRLAVAPFLGETLQRRWLYEEKLSASVLEP